MPEAGRGGRVAREWLRVILVLLGLLAVTVTAAVGYVWVVFGAPFGAISERRERVLSADPKALLAACREVLSHRGEYRVSPSVGGGGTPEELRRTYPDSQDPEMPSVIRELRPIYLSVDESSVRIEMGGGFHGFGVLALAVGADAAIARTVPNSRELVAGLWYYECDD